MTLHPEPTPKPTGPAGRGRLARRVLLAAAFLVAGYGGANLVAVGCVPMLHDFTFTVVVTDRETSAPLGGAALSWKRTNPRSGRQWLEPIGTTDSTGHYSFAETFQEQPRWASPMLGHFRFPGLVLDVRSPRHVPREIRVAEALRGLSYGDSSGTIRVDLGSP